MLPLRHGLGASPLKAASWRRLSKLAIETLEPENRGDFRANASEAAASSLPGELVFGSQQGITRRFDLGDLLLHQREPIELTADLGLQSWWQGSTVTGLELLQPRATILP